MSGGSLRPEQYKSARGAAHQRTRKGELLYHSVLLDFVFLLLRVAAAGAAGAGIRDGRRFAPPFGAGLRRGSIALLLSL